MEGGNKDCPIAPGAGRDGGRAGGGREAWKSNMSFVQILFPNRDYGYCSTHLLRQLAVFSAVLCAAMSALLRPSSLHRAFLTLENAEEHAAVPDHSTEWELRALFLARDLPQL